MPFKSEKQRRWMHANHPEMAKKWEKKEKMKKETKVKSLIKKMVREMLDEIQLDEKCWKGYEKKGTKMMFGKRYPNCVKKEEKITEKAKRDYKAEYNKYGSSTKAKKYRAELNAYNRKKGTYGNGDKKDASHRGGKIVGFEAESKNRGRAEKSRLKQEGKLTEAIQPSKAITKVLDMADGGYGKLGGKIVDGLSANLFKTVYNKANDTNKEKMNKMNEKQLYVFLTKLWSKFGRQVKI